MSIRSDRLIIVSVVRDFEMYQRCVSNNPNVCRAELVQFDNRIDNQSIPVLYNRFLDDYDYSRSAWIVFCHEDFELLEDLGAKLNDACAGFVYGPIGGKLVQKYKWVFGGIWKGEFKGHVVHSAKDGGCPQVLGDGAPTGTIVDTVDCQCIILHSSLVQSHRLRFDKNLSFDLYAEDFCMGAWIDHGVGTAILNLKCHHHSKGMLTPRFFRQKKYLDSKYKKYEAFSTVFVTLGGGRTFLRRLQKNIKRVMDWICPWMGRLLAN